MIKRISAKEARARFAEILGQVHFGKDTIIVEKQGKPMVAVIDVEQFDRLMKAWDEPFKVLDRVWAKNQDKDPDRIERDVTQAVGEARGRAQARTRRRA